MSSPVDQRNHTVARTSAESSHTVAFAADALLREHPDALVAGLSSNGLIHNRSSILATLQSELEREETSMTGLVYVDLDKFKSVNDALGHAAGDELLTQVAERLRAAGRADDVVGRLGGDEFLVLLRDIPGPEVAMRVAHRISTLLSGKFELSSDTVELRASVGVACRGSERITAEELVKHADAAMYGSKEQALGLPVLAAGPQGPQPLR